MKTKPRFAGSRYHEGTKPAGILLLHGFTSTPQSVGPLFDAFAGADYTVSCPLLSGHGGSWRDLARIPYRRWVDDAVREYDRLAGITPAVFAAGLSMGGTLALALALERPGVRGLMLINHALGLAKSPLVVALLPVLKYIVPTVPAVGGDLKDPAAHEETCSRTPLRATHELCKLMRRVRDRLGEVHAPALIFKSREDHVIPVSSATRTRARIGSSDCDLVVLENSYHVATLDFDQARIAQCCLSFLEKRLGGHPQP